MREIIFDTETTGFDPETGDRMVEIGCVELMNRMPTGQHFHAYFNPERSMPKAAEEIHGLGDAFLAGKPLFAAEVERLLDFIADSPLIAHNADFDFKFLNHELRRCGRDEICHSRKIDTIAIARVKHPGAKHSLDALCVRYGIDRSMRTKHGALLDAELLAQLYIELTDGRQIGLSLADDAAGSIESCVSIVSRGPARPPRPHAPSDSERLAHAEFIAALESPLWLTRKGRASPL
mgnify:CR=1 FL=1